jgi:hypothetical protein
MLLSKHQPLKAPDVSPLVSAHTGASFILYILRLAAGISEVFKYQTFRQN